MRGALRTSRTRGGMRWTQKARETHAPDAYGEVAWFGRRGAGAKLAIGSAGDGGKRAVLREEREVSRKATAQGRPGCSACTCMLVCAFAMCTGTRDRGCSKHPVFPAPSIQEEGNETFKPRVKHAARMRKLVQPSLRAQRSNPPLHLRRYGLLRFARNDVVRSQRVAQMSAAQSGTTLTPPRISLRFIRATLALVVRRSSLVSRVALTRTLFRCFGARCGSRHTLSVLSASSLAKAPHCSQTCRK
jgi:hypothetical protein